MISYYLHHTPGKQPLEVLSDYPLDLQPGSWICYQDYIFVVDHRYPIVQNRDMGHRVHVVVQEFTDPDKNRLSGRQTMAELSHGIFFGRFGN